MVIFGSEDLLQSDLIWRQILRKCKSEYSVEISLFDILLGIPVDVNLQLQTTLVTENHDETLPVSIINEQIHSALAAETGRNGGFRRKGLRFSKCIEFEDAPNIVEPLSSNEIIDFQLSDTIFSAGKADEPGSLLEQQPDEADEFQFDF